mmetsp:Transcript_503/g.1129  ORF Transcript_503/g.1129 Transcript_503/m.1129 type:complete len:175 (+) Transcript_503:23-547(+)
MSAANANPFEPIDFALRVCESTAFCIHAILAITEPCTGCLRRYAFREGGDKGGMPHWFWPIAGVLLLIVAAANFSRNEIAIFAAQAYIAAFHSGAVFYHLILGHHPATGCAPGFFVVMAFFVMWIRTAVWVALIVTFVSILVAKGLSSCLVTPPASKDGGRNTRDSYLLGRMEA